MLIPSSDYTMTGIDWGNVNTRYVPYVLCLNTCHSDTSNTESRASIGLSYAAWTFDVGRPFWFTTFIGSFTDCSPYAYTE